MKLIVLLMIVRNILPLFDLEDRKIRNDAV